MTNFKTSKAELLFVVADKEINGANLQQLYSFWLQLYTGGTVAKTKQLPQGNWQLIGKLSEVSEEVAKGLVDEHVSEWFTDKFYYKNYIEESKIFDNATASLTSIATHLGMELTDNIYLLGKK